MNGLRRDGLDRVRDLAARVKARTEPPVDIVICPPATLVNELRAALDGSGIALGAQDCAAATPGAHTGDIGAAMLADAGCGYVIVGHSERRAGHGETDATVRAKAAAARGAGLVAIVCVGETAERRDAGQALTAVESQLESSVPDGAGAATTVVAYEPVWAIGTGLTASAAEIAEMHGHLHGRLAERFGDDGAAIRLLYGGSVKPDNAAALLATEHVDGALVGGASLTADEFWAICEAGG